MRRFSDSRSGRLLIVLAIVGTIHITARIISSLIVRMDYKCQNYVPDSDGSGYICGDYGSIFEYNVSTTAGHIVIHLGAAVVAFVTAVILNLLYDGLRWLVQGKLPTKPDPCQNPACPCKRHAVEREEAHRTNVAIAAGVAGTIGGMTVAGS